ncbi:hypothetical protein [uncultured Methanobrevibacter sp.]|uniref:hypothetical protein n=1 Tax=uncultured Methanobrevibacter sp. TaxID=253161 RepID=UPI0025F2A62F|nr:hypothetical protein [uncultured Methanobrevibacter sp.]
MKRKILTILTIFLIATSGLSFVSAQNELDDILITESEEENNESRSIRQRETSEDSLNLAEERNSHEDRTGEEVKALESGYRNVSFDDGYNGYCVNHNLQSTSRGEKFTVENTTNIISSRYGESVGNYLKILFVDHYNYTMNPTTDLSQVIWTFTDYDYKNSNNEIIKSILESASNGRIIPDHGAVTKINNTTEAIFDFELLNSQYGRTQNFFGYKINYRTLEIIEDEILGSDPENNTTIENNTTTNNNTEKTPQNNTTIENNTTTNNNTEENPQNNTTIENNTTTNNNTEETPQNNTTIEKQENNTIISKTNENQTPNLNKIKESDLAKYNTGNELTVIGIAILIIGFILLIKYTRD